MTILATPESLTDGQLTRFADLIYEVAGIRISAQKKSMLSNRLRRRLKATGIDDYDAYLIYLKKQPRSDGEWNAFLQEVSTHETYLFRDECHWEWFQETFLQQVVSEARRGARPRSIRIWSAACSTGDEAHTIATCIAAKLPHANQWKIEILGTDIGVDAVRQAQTGEFNERSMRLVPDDSKRRFFRPHETQSGSWTFKAPYKDWLTFRQHNLLNPIREAPFDLVFLKNVLIYFDSESKSKVLKNVLPRIKPGGFLLSAAAEGITNLVDGLNKQNTWLFEKPANQ